VFYSIVFCHCHFLFYFHVSSLTGYAPSHRSYCWPPYWLEHYSNLVSLPLYLSFSGLFPDLKWPFSSFILFDHPADYYTILILYHSQLIFYIQVYFLTGHAHSHHLYCFTTILITVLHYSNLLSLSLSIWYSGLFPYWTCLPPASSSAAAPAMESVRQSASILFQVNPIQSLHPKMLIGIQSLHPRMLKWTLHGGTCVSEPDPHWIRIRWPPGPGLKKS
jgi:hypothetical protein